MGEKWTGIKGIVSFDQDEKPEKAKAGDIWVKTNDYTGDNITELCVGNNEWRRMQLLKIGGPGSDFGYVCSGYDVSNDLSIIDRFIFPFDSGTATHIGNLTENKRRHTANNSSIHGYICGGYDTSNLSIIDRFTYPFDSGSASYVGNLSSEIRVV